MRPAHFEVDDLGRRRRAATARLGVSKERAQGAAFAELATTAERQAITSGELAIAIFGPARQRPAVGAIGRSGADRQEILSQCAVTAEEAARRNRMIDIEHILRADAADRAVAVYRQIDRPAFADLQRLRQAIGGKAARAIFADLLLVRGGEKEIGRASCRERVCQYV